VSVRHLQRDFPSPGDSFRRFAHLPRFRQHQPDPERRRPAGFALDRFERVLGVLDQTIQKLQRVCVGDAREGGQQRDKGGKADVSTHERSPPTVEYLLG